MDRNYLFLIVAVLFLVVSCNKDECDDIICVNGDCVNGVCDCDEGYQGPDCDTEKEPVKMNISSVTVTSFPPTDNGAGWDISSGADVYFRIIDPNGNEFNSSAVQNLMGNHTWSINYEFSDPSATYTIRLYDQDDIFAAPDDYMGGITFTPWRKGDNFPSTLNIDCQTCVVSFEFSGVNYFHL